MVSLKRSEMRVFDDAFDILRPPLDQGAPVQYAVNRGEFYRALKCEFDTYLRELRDTKNIQLRARFIKKADIAKEC